MRDDWLEEARNRITRGEMMIARQRELIAELRETNYSTSIAEEVLHTLEGSQAMNIKHLSRLQRLKSG